MLEKRTPPLENPPQEKSVVAVAPSNKYKATSDNVKDKSRGDVRRGDERRVKPAEAWLKCQMCGRIQKLVFRFGNPPEWHKCTWCGELQPMDGYRVIAYGLELPRVLAPHEVKARGIELELLHADRSP